MESKKRVALHTFWDWIFDEIDKAKGAGPLVRDARYDDGAPAPSDTEGEVFTAGSEHLDDD